MLQHLQIFQGETTTAAGLVYLRLPKKHVPLDRAGFRLGGTVRGPFSDYATTLPSTYSFRPLKDDDALIAEAVIPDPCTWNIDVPSTYKVEARLFSDEEVVATTRLTFGFKRFGFIERSFFHEGKRWVMRGAAVDPETFPVLEDGLRALRESRLVAWVRNPTDDFCVLASNVGVMVLADLSDLAVDIVADRLTEFVPLPAVAAAIVHCEIADLRVSSRGSLLIGSRMPDADFVFSPRLDRADEFSKPVVVVGAQDGQGPADWRRNCETLQAEVAPRAFAGYVVSP